MTTTTAREHVIPMALYTTTDDGAIISAITNGVITVIIEEVATYSLPISIDEEDGVEYFASELENVKYYCDTKCKGIFRIFSIYDIMLINKYSN